MTAAEFYKDNIGIYDSPCEMMVAFAKFHCKEQEEAIYEKAYITTDLKGRITGWDKDSIRNAYPLTNIK